jgi:hypothetical protein
MSDSPKYETGPYLLECEFVRAKNRRNRVPPFCACIITVVIDLEEYETIMGAPALIRIDRPKIRWPILRNRSECQYDVEESCRLLYFQFAIASTVVPTP